MNIEEKTKLAHEYLRDIISNWNFDDSFNPVSEAWQYADAMEAEYKKREKEQKEKDAEDAQAFFDKLTKNEDGSCRHFHTTLNGSECFDCGEKLNSTNSSQLEWQPDWSVAPECAVAWVYHGRDVYSWYSVEPIKEQQGWFVGGSLEYKIQPAPSFDYQGDWKDSLRKRPK